MTTDSDNLEQQVRDVLAGVQDAGILSEVGANKARVDGLTIIMQLIEAAQREGFEACARGCACPECLDYLARLTDTTGDNHE